MFVEGNFKEQTNWPKEKQARHSKTAVPWILGMVLQESAQRLHGELRLSGRAGEGLTTGACCQENYATWQVQWTFEKSLGRMSLRHACHAHVFEEMVPRKHYCCEKEGKGCYDCNAGLRNWERPVWGGCLELRPGGGLTRRRRTAAMRRRRAASLVSRSRSRPSGNQRIAGEPEGHLSCAVPGTAAQPTTWPAMTATEMSQAESGLGAECVSCRGPIVCGQEEGAPSFFRRKSEWKEWCCENERRCHPSPRAPDTERMRWGLRLVTSTTVVTTNCPDVISSWGLQDRCFEVVQCQGTIRSTAQGNLPFFRPLSCLTLRRQNTPIGTWPPEKLAGAQSV